MGIGGVFEDRQFGCVTKYLVQNVGGVALGGDDDLGAVGGVLVGDVRVLGDSLIQKIA